MSSLAGLYGPVVAAAALVGASYVGGKKLPDRKERERTRTEDKTAQAQASLDEKTSRIIDDLQAQVTGVLAQNAEQSRQIDNLISRADTANTRADVAENIVKELRQELGVVHEQVAELQAQVSSRDRRIAELTAQQ